MKKPNHLNFKDDPARIPGNSVVVWRMPSPVAVTISSSECPQLPDEEISLVYLRSIKKNGAGVNTDPVLRLSDVFPNTLKIMIIIVVSGLSFYTVFQNQVPQYARVV